MRLPRVLAALGVLVVLPAAGAVAAEPLGTPTRLVHVGPGATESSQRQVVRTRDGVVYIVSVEDAGWGVGDHAELHAYRATTAGIPTAFELQDPEHEPRVEDPLRLSGGDVRIDAEGTIHVTYAQVDGDAIAVMYRTFDTVTGAWGSAETITAFPADGDGIRGRVVSAIALDRFGAQLVVTASSSGVSAWSRVAGEDWSRAALSGEYGLHPSLAIDSSGRAHLAWLSSPYGEAPSIRYATRAPDGAWSEPEVVASERVLSNDTLDQSPSIAYDARARPVVAWLDDQDDVAVARRDASGAWIADGPTDAFSHSPGLYLRGDDRIVFLGHDAEIQPAYLSYEASSAAWSSVLAFDPPAAWTARYAYDGGASPRFDPLFDPDCGIVDVAFFDEDSDLPGRMEAGKPDLFYAAVTLPEPAGGCPNAGGGEPPTEEPPAEKPPAEKPPAAPTTLLGEEGVGSQTDSNASGMAEAFQATASSTGAVSSISVYLDESSTGAGIAVGLYADADGRPGVLLAQGTGDAAAARWNAVAIPETRVTAGDRYWVALLGLGAGQIAFRDEPGGRCRSETTPAAVALEALPQQWVTGNEWDDCPLSAFGVGA